jgi:hypothetical protein
LRNWSKIVKDRSTWNNLVQKTKPHAELLCQEEEEEEKKKKKKSQ